MYLIFTFIFDTATEVFTLLVIFYFSPILLMVTDIISPMLLQVTTTIQDGQDLPDVVLNPIGYLIVLFASLIYNEIIILNFCNLSKDTKKFVELRLNEEKDDLKKQKLNLKKEHLRNHKIIQILMEMIEENCPYFLELINK